jgi:hypothetical protein
VTSVGDGDRQARTAARVGGRIAVVLALGLVLLTGALVDATDRADAAPGDPIPLFANIHGPATVQNINVVTSGDGYAYAMPFVPTVSGHAHLWQFYPQCVGLVCSADGTIELRTDASGRPSDTVLGSVSFTATETTPGSPFCEEMASNPLITAGTRYWAVLPSGAEWMAWHFQSDAPGGTLESSDNGATWHPNVPDKTLGLNVSDGATCAPVASPLPPSGTPIGDMITRSGRRTFNTIAIKDKGLSPLTITGWSFSGPDAPAFTLLRTEPYPEVLARPYTTPRDIAVNAVGILYVVCTGPPDTRVYRATLSVSTNDPNRPTLTWPVECLVDNTPPTVAYLFEPNGENGWFRTATAPGLVRGIDPESNNFVKDITCTLDGAPFEEISASIGFLSVPGPGARTLTCTATDVADNVGEPLSTVVRIDDGPPTITPAPVTADGQPYTSGTWTRQDVTVRYVCADAVSGPASCPDDVTVTSELFTTTASPTIKDVAGNTSAPAAAVTVQIDRTDPTITATATRADGQPYAAGTWSDQPVTVRYECFDTLVGSGVASCPADHVFDHDGIATTPTARAVDGVGNVSAPAERITVQIDQTVPTIATSATRASGAPYVAGTWSNEPVAVEFTCADPGGTDASGIPSRACPDVQRFDDDGVATSTAPTTTDGAGNTSAPAETVTVWIDQTPPTITGTATFDDGTAYRSGEWTTEDVRVEYTCTDPGGADASGLASCPDDQTYDDEGALDAVATDVAGNTTPTDAAFAVRIDRTPPTVVATATLADGTAYVSGATARQAVTVRFTCADPGGSGVPADECPADQVFSVDGTSTSTVAVVHDRVGHVSEPSATFTVVLDTTPTTITATTTTTAPPTASTVAAPSDTSTTAAPTATTVAAPAPTAAPAHASSGTLAFTGGDVTMLVVLGAGATVGGLGLLVASRRRPTVRRR